MKGFEDQYKNIIDYIVRITYQIWEEKILATSMTPTVKIAEFGMNLVYNLDLKKL